MLSSKFAAFNYRFPFSSYCYYRDCLSLTRALSLSHVHTRSSDETQLTFTSPCITKCQPVSLAIMFDF